MSRTRRRAHERARPQSVTRVQHARPPGRPATEIAGRRPDLQLSSVSAAATPTYRRCHEHARAVPPPPVDRRLHHRRCLGVRPGGAGHRVGPGRVGLVRPPAERSPRSSTSSAGVLSIVLLFAVRHSPVRIALVLSALLTVSAAATPAAGTATLWVAQRRRLPVAIGVALAGVAGHLIRAALAAHPGPVDGPVDGRHRRLVRGAGRLGRAEPGPARAGGLAGGPGPAGRGGPGAPHRRGQAGRADQDRPGDARRARAPAVPAGRVRRGAGVPAGRAAGGAGPGRRGDPGRRPPGAGGAARGDRRAPGRPGRAGAGPPAADPVRPAPAARRGPRRRHAGPAGRPAGRRRYGAGRAGPDRLPGRPGRADQRAQARARAGGDRPARRPARPEPAGRGHQPDRPRAPRDPGRIPGSGSGLVGLRERVQLAGGRLDAKSGHGRFRLWAVLPWPA